MSVRAEGESGMSWAEDRALLGSTPSADPGAKTGAGTGGQRPVPCSLPIGGCSGIGTKAANRCHLIKRAVYLISRPRFLHFTVNQHNPTRAFGAKVKLERFQERQKLVPLRRSKHKDIVQLDFLRLATVPADGFVDRQGRAVM